MKIATPRKLDDLGIGSPSPWGAVDCISRVSDGIAFVTTASHGGFVVDPDHLNQIDATYPEHRSDAFERGPWFEEDCRAAYVVCTFPTHFSDAEQKAARASLRWMDERREKRAAEGR